MAVRKSCQFVGSHMELENGLCKDWVQSSASEIRENFLWKHRKSILLYLSDPQNQAALGLASFSHLQSDKICWTAILQWHRCRTKVNLIVLAVMKNEYSCNACSRTCYMCCFGIPHLQQESRFKFQFSAQLPSTAATHSTVVHRPTSSFSTSDCGLNFNSVFKEKCFLAVVFMVIRLPKQLNHWWLSKFN